MCQSPHLAKFPGMKSISKPPLPIEIFALCQNLSLDNYSNIASHTPPWPSQKASGEFYWGEGNEERPGIANHPLCSREDKLFCHGGQGFDK